MTNLAGFVADESSNFASGPTSGAVLGPLDLHTVAFYNPPIEEVGTPAFAGTLNSPLVIPKPHTTTLIGLRADTQEITYHTPVFFTPDSSPVGLVGETQQYSVIVYNSEFHNIQLTSITEYDHAAVGGAVVGVTFPSPDGIPSNFLPLEEKVFTLTVDATGPKQFDITYTFTFDNGEVYYYKVTGSRGVNILASTNVYRPDWSQTVTEVYTWKTEILESMDGSEQRRRLRQFPAFELRYSTLLIEDVRRSMQNILHDTTLEDGLHSMWNKVTYLTSSASANDTVLSVKDPDKIFYVGDSVLLVSSGANTLSTEEAQVYEVGGVTASTLTISTPLINDHHKGSEILAVSLATTPEKSNLVKLSPETARATLTFRRNSLQEGVAVDTATTYRGVSVLEHFNYWDGGESFSVDRQTDTLEFANNGVDKYDVKGFTFPTYTLKWKLDGYLKIKEFREWLYAREGSFNHFWTPTYNNDFRLIEDIGTGDTTIVVALAEYFSTSLLQASRKDIRIELLNGTVFYKRITSASRSSSYSENAEELVIDTALGQGVTVKQVRSISFLSLMRLNTDRVEVVFKAPWYAECTLTTKGVNIDL